MDSLRFDILWGPGTAGGAAMAVVDALCVINTLAAMRHPAQPPPMQWRRVPLTGRPGARAPAADVVVVPGWIARDGPEVDQQVQSARAALPRLRATLNQGGALLGVFTGVALLAAAGVLHGRRATAPWPFIAPVMRQALAATDAEGALSTRDTDRATPTEPLIHWCGDAPWTADRSVWTCASPVTATEALLDLVECTPWASLAHAARDVLLPAPMRQAAAVAHARAAGSSLAQARVPTGMVERARQWLEDHLADPYDVQRLAEAAATSPRSLARHFGATHGMSPRQYLERLRVERAALLLQTTYLPAEEIGRMCGMPSPSTLRRVFASHTGELPGEYRQRYRLRTPRPRWGSAPVATALAGRISPQAPRRP